MSESREHINLVERLMHYARKLQATKPQLYIYVDHMDCIDKPPKIGGHIPDLLLYHSAKSIKLIGEAKTNSDFRSPRSIEQLESWLIDLKSYEQSALVIAVHWSLSRTALQTVNYCGIS